MMVALAGARNQGGGNRYSLGEGRRLGFSFRLNFNKYFYKKRHPSGAVFYLS